MNPIPSHQVSDTCQTGWHGDLKLVFAYRPHTTQLIREQASAPLKVQRPFYPEGSEVCHLPILHTAGGIVGGDTLSLNFHLQPHAQALITTAAASKIYRSTGLEAKQIIQIKVDTGACLEWLPQETIAFNGSIYRQDMRVELAIGASWIGWEITRFGRSARGERFLQGQWRNHTEIWQQGRPLWIDRQWLPGSEETIDSSHGLAGQPVVASLVWIGQPALPELVEKVRLLWLTSEDKHQGEAGVTRLTHGLLCRYRGASTTEVRNWFTTVWHLLRQSLWERPATLPRVWQR